MSYANLWYVQKRSYYLIRPFIANVKVASLDDVRSSSANDNNAAKSMALDHLGLIAARLKACALKFFTTEDRPAGQSSLLPLEEVRCSFVLQLIIFDHVIVDYSTSGRAGIGRAVNSSSQDLRAFMQESVRRSGIRGRAVPVMQYPQHSANSLM